jgi:hypothetical protein
VFGRDILLTVLPGGADRDPAAPNVDREIHRLREGRPFLDVVVGDELEVTALRKDCSFIINRAILETEEQARGNPIAPNHLDQIAYREHATSFCTKREEAVDAPFQVPHGYGLSRRTTCKAHMSKAINGQHRRCSAGEPFIDSLMDASPASLSRQGRNSGLHKYYPAMESSWMALSIEYIEGKYAVIRTPETG